MADEEVKGRIVLKRKVGESIVIGDGAITITIMDGHRLCIVAPKNIAIHRSEVFDAIKAERNLE
jgi:carbon storage regulator